ncbi:MAG TPA: hypothetical protein VK421_00940 [Pyrinomonadaceae bacterium]|nr:hypothetical protein [Pyrinomonadaceae bacterium]
MTEPAYPAARAVAETVRATFARHIDAARSKGKVNGLASAPDAQCIERVIDAAFWASLRREEGHSPKISLAFLPPAQAAPPLLFERRLPLEAGSLAKLAPAVERPGIHLGVWYDDAGMYVWGTTRSVPKFCFILEVVEPGLLVIKYRRRQETGKYVNVAVLKGDEIKLVSEEGSGLPDCPELITPLLGFGAGDPRPESLSVLVQLAASMRAHGRGGSLLVVPQGSAAWRDSVVWPAKYQVDPPYAELAELMGANARERDERLWQEALQDAVEAVGGLTAVDGATVISDSYELLAFGVKIRIRDGSPLVEKVVLTEPVVGGAAAVVSPVELGGTRHLSAAQFTHDQRDTVALVASQDGRFTVFAWSPCELAVHAHRVETLLL